MNKFKLHLRDKNATFHCFAAGDETEAISFSVTVNNYCVKGADANKIKQLELIVPNSCEQLKNFYREMNGAMLYCQGMNAKILFFSISDLEIMNERWKSWFDDCSLEDLWDYQIHGLAFGEVCESGNYFVYYDGKVYYSNHDDWDGNPLANSLYEFLDNISPDPAKFLYNLGCYSRYKDGKTKTQWIPKKYTKGV